MQNVNFWSVNYPFKLELVSPFLCFFFPFFISPTLPWSTLSFSIFLPLMSSLLCMSYDNYTLVATEKWQVRKKKCNIPLYTQHKELQYNAAKVRPKCRSANVNLKNKKGSTKNTSELLNLSLESLPLSYVKASIVFS